MQLLRVPPASGRAAAAAAGQQRPKQQKLGTAAAGCTTTTTPPPPRPQQQRQRRAAVVVAAASPSSSSSSSSESDSWRLPAHLKLGGGDAILLPRERADLGPRFDLTWEQAVELQLAALRDNDKPCFDHGVEVLYRFANFDPFQRSQYFGKSFDLGQFERFRRIMHTPAYKPLCNHDAAATLSTLRVSERCYKARLHVTGEYGHDERTYEVTMVQRLGGRYDGWWFTESLVADGNDWAASIISY